MARTGVRYSTDGNNWFETYQDGIIDKIDLQRLKPETQYTAYAFYEEDKEEITSSTVTFTTASPYMYLTIVNEYDGDNDFTLDINGTPKSSDLSYNVAGRWILFDLGLQSQTVTIPKGGTLKLRSTTGFSKDSSNYFQFRTSETFSLAGNIASVFDYTDMEHFTAIPDYGLYGLFYYCSTLVKVDVDWNDITAIGVHGCGSMFSSCTALETITDPFETVTTVGDYGCESMFAGCRVLDHEFDLSAITRVGVQAFNTFLLNCDLIDTMVAPSLSTWDTTIFNNWLKNVAASGVIKKSSALSIPTNSDSGVPSGWTAVDTAPYITITNEYAGSQYITFNIVGTPATTDLEFSLNDGVTWNRVDLSLSSTAISVPQGGQLKIRSTTGFNYNSGNRICISGGERYSVTGHIATLIDYTQYSSITAIPNNCFYSMFYADEKLISADIDFSGITTIGDYSCRNMFNGCSLLTTAPDLSSITSIGIYGFNGMLRDCPLLAIAPDLSSVTSVNNQGCSAMFVNCSALTTAPDLSSVTSVGNSSFENMFVNCSNMSDITSPNVLQWSNGSYGNWVSGVAASGTFHKPSALTVPVGVNGCPADWTVVNY